MPSNNIYDDEKTRSSRPDSAQTPSDDELRRLTGIGNDEEGAMDRESQAGAKQDLASQESGGKSFYNPVDRKANGASKNENLDKSDQGSKDSNAVSPAKLNEAENKNNGSPSTGIAGIAANGPLGAGKKFAAVFLGSRKRKTATGGGIIGGILVSLGIVGFTTVSGPLQFIHASQLLSGFHFGSQSSMNDNRSAKFILYALSGKAAKGRLGIVDNKIADKMEAKLGSESGLKSVYSPTTQRLIGYEVIDRDKASGFLDDMEKDGLKGDSTLEGKDIDGKPVKTTGVNFGDEGFRTRRSITRTAIRSTGVNKVTSAITKRLLVKRGGVNFHPLKNVVRKQADSYATYKEEQQKERAKAIEDGTGAGGTAPDPAIKEERTKITDKLKSVARTASGPVIVLTVACTIKDFSSSIDAQNLENVQELERLGMNVVNTGAQIQTGQDFNLEQLGALNDVFYDPKTGTSFFDDPGIQSELGQPTNETDYAADVKPGKEKPGIFTLIDNVPTFGFCTLLQAAASAPVLEQAGNALNFVISGALHLIGLKSPQEYLDQASKYFASGAVNALARGSLAGGQSNIGTKLAANDAFRASGGRVLTGAESNQVQQTVYAEQQQTLASASFYDKYLSLHTGTSLLASAVLAAPHSLGQVADAISRFPSTIGNLGFMLLGSHKAAAAATPYNYGFPTVGFSEAELNDSAYDDPFANETYMLEGDRLDRMNSTFGDNCFGMQVTRAGDLVYGASKDPSKTPDYCNDTGNVELTHYRFYLADVINSDGMACYEDDQDSCDQLNGTSQGAAAPAPAPTPPNNGVTGDGPTLAKQVLALVKAGKIDAQGDALADITAASNGQTVTPGPIGGAGAGTTGCAARTPTLIDPQLLQVMINIAAKYSYQINDITSGHNCDTGRHTLGRAFDVFYVNGQAVTWTTQADRDFATYVVSVLSTLLPNGSKEAGNMGGLGVGDSSCLSSPIPHPANINYFDDSCDQVHIDVGFPPK